MGATGGRSVCDGRDGAGQQVSELGPATRGCWSGCVCAMLERSGKASVREPAILANWASAQQTRDGEQRDRDTARGARVAWSNVDAGINPTVHRFGAVARRSDPGGTQRRRFGGEGFLG